VVRSPRRLAPSLLVLVLGLLAASGCAAPAPKMSFGEAGFRIPLAPASPAPVAEIAAVASDASAAGAAEEPEGPVAPPAVVPVPESVATEAAAGPPIDAVLLRFAAEARSRRSRLAAGPGFAGEAAAAWRALVAELDAYLARALPQTPLLELVRARVTVEAEWDYDQRRFGPAPRELAAAVESRAARLGRRVEAARALGLALFTAPPPALLRWPVEQAGLSSPFGMRTHPLDGTRKMHRGVDFAAAPGRVVSAAAAGWVVRAGWTGGYGLLVEIRHADDVTTRYSHLSAILCAPGDAVEAGQPLGLVGRTGLATGPHLHFEVWRAGEPRDPLPWLGLAVAAGGSARL
jgi:murein DD-endopeptidase MepM/ murein hydrolase activator NlpD